MASAVPPMFGALRRTQGAVTRSTRRGLAGAPGRTKRPHRRRLTAADLHSLHDASGTIFPFTASTDRIAHIFPIIKSKREVFAEGQFIILNIIQDYLILFNILSLDNALRIGYNPELF